MAREPLVMCGSIVVPWTRFAFAIMDSRMLEEPNIRSAITNVLNLISSSCSFWTCVWIKEFQLEAPQRRWVNSLSTFWFRNVLRRIVDTLEREPHFYFLCQLGVIGAIVAFRIIRGLRPLDTAWLLLPICTTIATQLLTSAPHQVNSLHANWHCFIRREIANLLNVNRNRAATEPKDKVYALYGILQSLGVELEEPSYWKSLENVYQTFIVDMML